MLANVTGRLIQVLSPVLFIALVVLVQRRKQKSPRQSFVSYSDDQPVLVNQGLFNASGLQSAYQGQVEGFDYNLLADDTGRVTALINLGHSSSTHILAFGDKSLEKQLTISAQWLQAVQLEGDFPDYFHLYCTPGKEVELLQIFDPSTMALFADFCRAYNLEVYKESIYISQAGGARDTSDTTPMFADINNFLKENSLVLTRI